MEGFFFAGSATFNINVKPLSSDILLQCLLDSTVKVSFNLQNTKENKEQGACRADITAIVL